MSSNWVPITIGTLVGFLVYREFSRTPLVGALDRKFDEVQHGLGWIDEVPAAAQRADEPVTIYRGPFGLWHVSTGMLHSGRSLDGNLTKALRTLRDEGHTTVRIKRGGVQRPRYEERRL